MDARKYETIFIIKSNLNEEEIKVQIENVTALIEKNSGVIVTTEDWGKKKLAYEIKKEKYGHYVFMTFDSAPEFISILERNFRLNEKIIRHLIVLRIETKAKESDSKTENAESSWEAAEDKVVASSAKAGEKN